MNTDAVKNLEELPFSMKAEDLAKALNLSRSKAYAIMNTPGFPSFRVDRTLRVTRPALNDWLKEQQNL